MTEEKTSTREPIEVRFSVPQIVGGALAAATAATIGSQLGVAGTILGAAVASVVGGVAGTLYSAGLDRTHRRVSQAIHRGYDRLRTEDDIETRVLPAVSVDDDTTVPGAGTPTARQPAVPATPATRPDGGAPDHSRRNRVLATMGLTVAAIFVVAMLAITAVELALGHSIDGSSTTTVGGARRPTPTATTTHPSAPASATPSASETAPASATPSASASASATPSAPESSAVPTPEPSTATSAQPAVATPVATPAVAASTAS